MRIALDASRLTSGVKSGTQNYLYYLLKEMVKLDQDNEYKVYFKDNVPGFIRDEFENVPNFSFKALDTYLSWTQISLAMTILLDAPDILFTPWHTIPGIHNSKTKIVSTIHDLTGNSFTTKYTAKFSDKLIAVSNSTKDRLVEKYSIDESKIRVIYEGFDREFFSRSSEDEIDAVRDKYGIEGRYLLFVGTIGPRKNVANMLRAFRKLVDDGINAKFVLVGSLGDPFSSTIFELAKKLALDDEVMFPGAVDQSDLKALYSGAGVFVFASLEEGFGIPILEAMACRVPVITSNTSSMPEVAGEAAYYVDPDSSDSIYNGMKDLIEDADLASSLVNAGSDQIEKFSWERAAVETVSLFNEVAGKPAK